MKSIGAVEAFDHNDSMSSESVSRYVGESKLKLAWDTISTQESSTFCAKVLSSEPGCSYGCISFPPVQLPRDDVVCIGTLMYSVFGEPFEKKGIKFQASLHDWEFTKKFMTTTETLLAEGTLKPHREKVGTNGLEGVLAGLKDLEMGKVSGHKLVYLVQETP